MEPLAFCGLSDRGKVREKNEDSWFADADLGFFMVADGMGGRPGGALASDIVKQTLPPLIRNGLSGHPRADAETAGKIIRTAVADLSASVRVSGEKKTGYLGMGATVVAAWVGEEGTAIVVNLGDSRAYLYRNGNLTQISRDHSVTQILIENGEITPAQAADHPSRSQVTRYVGMEGEALPDLAYVPLQPGDRLLLCSDGLSSFVPAERLKKIVASVAGPRAICRNLVDAANEAGGGDNITALVVDWRADGEETRTETQSRTIKLERL
jgi:protein phosphatase